MKQTMRGMVGFVYLEKTTKECISRYRKTSLSKVQRIQEQAFQTVFINRTATYEELLNKASLPRLAHKRLQDILILM